MTIEKSLTLHSPRREEIEGQARYVIVSEAFRALRSAGIVAVGALIAVPAVALPPHFVVSALIFGCFALAAYALWVREILVEQVTFTCSCGEATTAKEIGVWSSDTWVRCPKCSAPWRLSRPTPA